MNIENLRNQIDEIDDEILILLQKRIDLVRDVRKYKKENNVEVLDSGRENEIISKIENIDFDHNVQLVEIYKLIMKLSKEQQHE